MIEFIIVTILLGAAIAAWSRSKIGGPLSGLPLDSFKNGKTGF